MGPCRAVLAAPGIDPASVRVGHPLLSPDREAWQGEHSPPPPPPPPLLPRRRPAPVISDEGRSGGGAGGSHQVGAAASGAPAHEPVSRLLPSGGDGAHGAWGRVGFVWLVDGPRSDPIYGADSWIGQPCAMHALVAVGLEAIDLSTNSRAGSRGSWPRTPVACPPRTGKDTPAAVDLTRS